MAHHVSHPVRNYYLSLATKHDERQPNVTTVVIGSDLTISTA
jgi:hypothetical protein